MIPAGTSRLAHTRCNSTSAITTITTTRRAAGWRPRCLAAASAFGVAGGNVFFHGGVWFRPSVDRFVVIALPFGVIVPLLTPAYVTLSICGAPYHYANGVYYSPTPGGYTVVAPPPSADTVQPVPPAPPPKAAPDPILYPRNGQNTAQTETDRQDCNRWATTQPSAMADASVFQRAVVACMVGRGYTVR